MYCVCVCLCVRVCVRACVCVSGHMCMGVYIPVYEGVCAHVSGGVCIQGVCMCVFVPLHSPM